ncbi:MAG: hypothetical protein KIT84_27000 [Labilithrix sp.]|nr:hypothetical protein [Labilithrix sp.]MCW5814704.1 hypothetical protein [Labilithrix sp.]
MKHSPLLLVLFVSAAGCDDPKPTAVDAGKTTVPSATVTVAAKDAAPPPFTMPERPIPKPETMVTQNAPEEVQMKAIAYMVAMKAPHPGDANADEAYANELVAKLKPISLAMDKGDNKAKWNRTEAVAGGRQIDLLMSDGCDAKAPFNAVVQRANVPLATLASHGVFVIRCNDQKRQCLQSTRDPDDVLCTTAPRHR